MLPARVAAIGRVAALLLLAQGANLAAQAPAIPTPAPAPAPRFTGTSFLLARYKAGSTASLYAARRIGPGMVVAGMIGKQNSNYHAFVLGGGTRLRLSRGNGVSIILAGAAATDGISLRAYALPRLSAGRFALTATTAAYRPITGKALPQVSADPVTASVRVLGSLRLGVAGTFVAVNGRGPDFAVGPGFMLRVPGGVLSMDVVERWRGRPPEVRGQFSAVY